MIQAYKPSQTVPVNLEELRFDTRTELERIALYSEEIVSALLDFGIGGDGGITGPVDSLQFTSGFNAGVAPGAGYTPPPNTADPNDGQSKGILRGLVWYDEASQSLAYYNDDIDVQVNMGRELLYRVGNGLPTMNNGAVVRVGGAFSGWPSVSLAQADTVTNSNVLGLVTGTLGNLSFGYVTAFGTVNGLDTTEDSEGNPVQAGWIAYLSENVAGGWTIGGDPVGSDLPEIQVPIGLVTNVSATAGSIAVSISRPPTMDGVRDVAYNGTAPGFLDSLMYDDINSLWKPSNMGVIRACELSAPGNGTGNLTATNSFNVASITRQSAGLYRVQLTTTSIYGEDILDWVVASITVSPGEAGVLGFVAKNGFLSGSDAVAGWFEFQIYYLETSGAGGNVAIETVPDDLESSDSVSIMVHITGDSSAQSTTT